MEDQKEKVYTITRFNEKRELKKFKKSESELNEEDILHFYRKLANEYNAAPEAAKMLFMQEAIPPYMELMKKMSGSGDVKN